MFEGDEGIYVAIGLALAGARRAKGMSQDQLAMALGLSRGSISNIEAGRQKMLVHTLLQAAVYLGVPAVQLLPNATQITANAASNITMKSSRPLQRSERDEVLAVLNRVNARDDE